jgi:hypothetical protein
MTEQEKRFKDHEKWYEETGRRLVQSLIAMWQNDGAVRLLEELPDVEASLPECSNDFLRPLRLAVNVETGKMLPDLPGEDEVTRQIVAALREAGTGETPPPCCQPPGLWRARSEWIEGLPSRRVELDVDPVRQLLELRAELRGCFNGDPPDRFGFEVAAGNGGEGSYRRVYDADGLEDLGRLLISVAETMRASQGGPQLIDWGRTPEEQEAADGKLAEQFERFRKAMGPHLTDPGKEGS